MAVDHHGDGQQKISHELAAIMQRFTDQVEGRARREFPGGRVGATDDGALAMAVAADPAHGIVRMDFGKPIAWVGMSPEQAVAIAEMLIQKARQVSRSPLTVNVG